eukprot:COSAG02_NODE_1338_length_13189_cov_28.102292_2_plen_37_part_00
MRLIAVHVSASLEFRPDVARSSLAGTKSHKAEYRTV